MKDVIIDFKALYESVVSEADEQIKDPKGKIVSGLEGMKPGAVMQAVAKSLGSSSPDFLKKHLVKILVNAAKNGKVKFDALKDAIKDFDTKNIEDNSNIDWNNVELDPSGITMKCFFDGDSKKIIDQFMKEYESEMKNVGKEIEDADKKLHADVKKAGIKIDDQLLDDNGLIVATVLDDKANKEKSGKELTKKVNDTIKQAAETKQLLKKTEEFEKQIETIKVDPEIEKLSDKELSKAVEQAEKDNTLNAQSLVKTLDDALTEKLGPDYRSSLLTGIYSKEELQANAKKNKLNKVDFSTIKSNTVIGLRIDFFGDEAESVVNEVVDDKAGYKLRKVDDNEKDKNIKKIFDVFEKVIIDTVGDKLEEDIIAYLKYWNGKNDDGNFDSLFVFAGVNGISIDESLNENTTSMHSNALIAEGVEESAKLPLSTVKKITDWYDKNWTKTLTPNEANVLKQLKAMSKTVDHSGGLNVSIGDPNAEYGFFDYKNATSPDAYDKYQKLEEQWNKIRDAHRIMMCGQTYETETTVNGVKKIIRIAGYTGNSAFKNAIKYAETHHEVAGDLNKISKEYLSGATEKSLTKIDDNIRTAKQITKATKETVNNASDINKPQLGFAVMPNGDKVPVFSYSTMSKQIADLDDIFDDGKIDPDEMKKLTGMGNRLNQYIEWAEQNKNSTNPLIQQKIELIRRLHGKYITVLDENPVGYSTDSSGKILGINDPKQAKVAAAASEDEDMKKASRGWKKALGLDKAFTAIGIARLAAKTTGIVLNKGKAITDMLGAQAMKYKEDKNIIADLRILLTNGKESKSKFEDTKFAVRFDVNDCKWHATCLDNRKMKFPEDKLIKLTFDSEIGKKFKKYCLDRWTSIFAPSDEKRAVIPFIINNAEKLRLDKGKLSKEFIDTIKKMSQNFSKIQTAMK